jgi:hypothetical protein
METTTSTSGPLWAGAAKVDITGTAAGATDDPLYAHIEATTANDLLYAKALIIKCDTTTVVIITVDAVAIAEIGTIRNDYLAHVRAQLHKDLEIDPKNVLINASHCHGLVCQDIEARTVQAVEEAWQNMVPVTVGVGIGHEDRIMENRRLKLKNGREADVRHAYALPPDEQVAAIGPVDPQIGILRLDKKDGQTLAVVYNFACHPIQGVPSGGNTADLSGFASRVIEDHSSEGAIAFFLQGCGADINPLLYKDVDHPADAEPLGTMLGLSSLQALKKIKSTEGGPLKLINETLELPRADLAQPIDTLQAEQTRLLQSLQGTSLNLKTFVPLLVKYHLSGDFPSYASHRYLHEHNLGRDGLKKLDAANRKNMEQYIANIYIMEELTRVQINLNLLKKNQALNLAAATKTIAVEVLGLRVGDFVLITFPGELPVQIGLDIKQGSPHPFTFISGVTNGYIYYTPTVEQLKNLGGAQEDSDCLLAPEWQALFEEKVAEILQRL